jgi:uncharacterized C2H2 Zn-finger protein
MARARKQQTTQEEFKCPECGRTFTRAAALGAHRRQAHGVAGTSKRSGPARKGSARTTTSAARTATRRSSTNGGSIRRRSRGAASSTSASNDGRGRGGADRDALLKALFPNGIPPKERIIRAANRWLDDAETLARMR